MQVFASRMVTIQKEISQPEVEEVSWEKLARCFSDFEAMAKDIQNQLVLLPATPKRRNEIERLSFQRIRPAKDSLIAWFGIDIFSGIKPENIVFLNTMLMRRHLFVHNGGRADQEYMDSTNDTSVRLHQQLVVKRAEIQELVPLLKKCAENLFSGFEAIGASNV